MSEIIGDEPCPQCRSFGRDRTGNHLIVFSDGNKYCNRCEYKEIKNKTMPDSNLLSFQAAKNLPINEIKSRGLSKEVCEHYEIRIEYDESNGEEKAIYIPIKRDGELTGFKVRNLKAKDKKDRFSAIGDAKNSDLFGQDKCGNDGKLIIVTEGELDAAATLQVLKEKGKNYRVVSIPNGASKGALKRHLEFLNKFSTIKICFDQDEAGEKAAKEAVNLFQPGQVQIVSLPEKDANVMLLQGRVNEFYAAIWNAKSVHLDGIITGSDTWEHVINKPKLVSVPYPDGWDEMNLKTYGMRLSELDTWTSGSGSGKTQLIRELEYHLLMQTKDNVGIMSLEEPLVDSVEALMSLHLNKRIHLPDVRETVSEADLYKAWKETSGTGRVHYYDHFGSLDDDSLIAKIRYMARGLDCKWIFLDHLSIVVSEFAAEGGERERIDTAMSRLKKLTQELGIWIGLIVHLRKRDNSGKSFEEGAVPSLDDLRGSGSIKQLSNNVYALARNQQEPSFTMRNTSALHVLKCRFTGETGAAGYLYFDRDTGRMTPIDNPFAVEGKDDL